MSGLLHCTPRGTRRWVASRVWLELRYNGEACGRHRVARLMCRLRLYSIPQHKKLRRQQPTPRPTGVQNHLERDFAAASAHTRWVTDITCIRTQDGWLYLCMVMDLHAVSVIGWSMSRCQDRHLVIQAVLMALRQHPEQTRVILLHSDRGCPFTSDEYQQFLADHNLICSMSAVGSCADNAAEEGFFGLLQRERVYR